MLGALKFFWSSDNSLDINKLLAGKSIKSVWAISIASQQTQSTAMSVMIDVFILSNRSDIFLVCEIEPEYLVPHNSACKCSNPFESSELLIAIVV